MTKYLCAAFLMAACCAAADRKSPASGAEMYKAYCASCHGALAKGDGPAARALKPPPPDMTLLARNNGGVFPALRVFQAIEGNLDVAAHGSRDMPVWGPIFTRMGGASASEVKLRVRNLTKYIESLQAK